MCEAWSYVEKPTSTQCSFAIPIETSQLERCLGPALQDYRLRREPVVTVATVLVPKNANTMKLFSYQVAEDSGGEIKCAPSYTLQTGSNTIYAETGGI